MISFLVRHTDDPVVKALFTNVPTPEGRFKYLNIIFKDSDGQKLRRLEYRKDFLKTVYWHIVKEYVVIKQGNQCQHCRNSFQLNVHHLTYKHHGWEHQYLEDLEILCRFCHTQENVSQEERIRFIEILAALKKFKTAPLFRINRNYDPRAIIEIRRMLDRNEVV